ncbi:uncharacterized protein TNCV_4310701 [Trichonephila clavipes]|nr:uncharacterized protein TNCV_4310701 [Trichonephila clavipes]
MSHLSFFTHANVFHHGGQPVSIELSIANIPEDGKDPDVICLTVDHSNLLNTPKDSRANRYIKEWLNLKRHLPDLCPLNTCLSASGASFVTRPKETEVSSSSRDRTSGKFLKSWDFFPINLEMLPHFRDMNDRTLPDHLHDEVHEDISECTMVNSYRFARYVQHFYKLQAEGKKQTAHLVE